MKGGGGFDCKGGRRRRRRKRSRKKLETGIENGKGMNTERGGTG